MILIESSGSQNKARNQTKRYENWMDILGEERRETGGVLKNIWEDGRIE